MQMNHYACNKLMQGYWCRPWNVRVVVLHNMSILYGVLLKTYATLIRTAVLFDYGF